MRQRQNNRKYFEKYVGDRAFYKMLFALVLPLIIQQGITNFVSLLDNVMVGGLGTLSMSAVSIVNQLIFVYNLAIFGGLSAASIFSTQFCGVRDWKGMRERLEQWKKENPEEFARMEKRRQEFMQERARRAQSKLDFFSSIDTSRMSKSDRATHDAVLKQLVAAVRAARQA